MSDEFPERALREFTYLDDESINSHLSSLGVGLETTHTASDMDESESTGRFAALVPSPFGAGSASVSHRSLGSSEEQREVDITVPYRFQELIRQVKE
jgi:hypothetical protein